MSNYLSVDTTSSGRIQGKEKLSKCRGATKKKKGGGQNNSVYNNCFMVIFLQSQLDFKQFNNLFN